MKCPECGQTVKPKVEPKHCRLCGTNIIYGGDPEKNICFYCKNALSIIEKGVDCHGIPIVNPTTNNIWEEKLKYLIQVGWARK